MRIIGISLDKSPEVAHKHAKSQGWDKVEILHIGASQAANVDYGVSGIPHIVLIDKQGSIAFTGNPHER